LRLDPSGHKGGHSAQVYSGRGGVRIKESLDHSEGSGTTWMLRTIDHNQQPTLNLRSHIPHLLTQSTLNHSNLPYVHKHFTTSHFKLPTLQQISTILFPPYLPTPHLHRRINLLTGFLLTTALGWVYYVTSAGRLLWGHHLSALGHSTL